jgi:hypothetical protein
VAVGALPTRRGERGWRTLMPPTLPDDYHQRERNGENAWHVNLLVGRATLFVASPGVSLAAQPIPERDDKVLKPGSAPRPSLPQPVPHRDDSVLKPGQMTPRPTPPAVPERFDSRLNPRKVTTYEDMRNSQGQIIRRRCVTPYQVGRLGAYGARGNYISGCSVSVVCGGPHGRSDRCRRSFVLPILYG